MPAVSLSDLRGTQAAEKLKNTDSSNSAKIQKSAREFEAVLLSHWLEQAEQSFASVPNIFRLKRLTKRVRLLLWN